MQSLKTFEFPAPVGERSVYDWDTLLDGGIYQLTEGEDYQCKSTTFATLLRNNAKKKGLTVRTAKVEGGMVIQAFENGQADEGTEEGAEDAAGEETAPEPEPAPAPSPKPQPGKGGKGGKGKKK